MIGVVHETRQILILNCRTLSKERRGKYCCTMRFRVMHREEKSFPSFHMRQVEYHVRMSFDIIVYEHIIHLVVFDCLSSVIILIVTLRLVKWRRNLISGPKLMYVCSLQFGEECNICSIRNIVTREIVRSAAKCTISAD
jgi:hypothetical protein